MADVDVGLGNLIVRLAIDEDLRTRFSENMEEVMNEFQVTENGREAIRQRQEEGVKLFANVNNQTAGPPDTNP